MANIFEELMNHNSSLTESIKPTKVTKESKCNCKKIKANRFRVESIKIFEDADFAELAELDTKFAVDVDDNEAEDEVVLVIDPEIPADDEVPEDAAEQLVGDYVYKCPICGANYVCACDAVETEAIEVDENGVPTECPICGDDADQILVGEIAPVEEVKDTEEEHEMQPVEVEEDEEEEVIEDSLKRKITSFGRRKVKEDLDVEVKADDSSKVEVEVNPEEEKVEVKVDSGSEAVEASEFEIEPDEEVFSDEVEFEEACGKSKSHRRVSESELSDDVAKYQKWVDYDMKRYGKISGRTQDLLDKAGLEVVKDQYGDYEVTAKYKAEGCKSEGCKEDEDEDKRPMRRRPARRSTKESKSLIFANKTFDTLMTKLIRENYKGTPKFITTKASLKEGKFVLKYIVTNNDKSYNGTLVAEGFKKNASKFTLKMKDKGVFTESYTRDPSFLVACNTVNGKVTPASIKYDYTHKVNEQVYRLHGTI